MYNSWVVPFFFLFYYPNTATEQFLLFWIRLLLSGTLPKDLNL